MIKLEKYDSLVEKEIMRKILKRGDWILFHVNYTGQDDPYAILARFESIDPSPDNNELNTENIRGFTVTEAMIIFPQKRVYEGLFIPRIKRVNEDLGSCDNPPTRFTLDFPKDLYVGKIEILKGLRETKGLENYVTWFEQFQFK
ncbi:hypothetical protein HYW75_02855 [Candidatus Pacearchaeota archaeon]|nr:hypothetical protein [Candidatus Pacearchaeota archaeon]